MCRIAEQKDKSLKHSERGGNKKSSNEFPNLVLNIGDFKAASLRIGVLLLCWADTGKSKLYRGEESSQSIRFPLIATRGWGMSDRELQWIFKGWLAVFVCFVLLLTGWQVELGAKDVQGSARLSKCLLNNAEVPKGKKGTNKSPLPPITTRGVAIEEAKDSYSSEFFGRFPVRQITLSALHTPLRRVWTCTCSHVYTPFSHRRLYGVPFSSTPGDLGVVLRTRQV